jgi:hypothetical protein
MTPQTTQPTESIYALLPKPVPVPPTRTTYRSVKLQAARKLPPPASTFGCFGASHILGAGQPIKKPHADLGPPLRTQAADPRVFLKGGEKKQRVPSKVVVEAFHYPEAVPTKAGLPRAPPLLVSLRSGVDFITANALEVINDEKEGGKEDEGGREDGEEMDYLRKACYGKVPAYLRRVQAEVLREDALIDTLIRQQQQQQQQQQQKGWKEAEEGKEGEAGVLMEALSEEERQALVVALKTKWDAVNAAYQKTAHQGQFQSAGARRRKAENEKVMSQLGQDIELLERAGGGVWVVKER